MVRVLLRAKALRSPRPMWYCLHTCTTFTMGAIGTRQGM